MNFYSPTMTRFYYLLNAYKARKYYRKRGYGRSSLPCYGCVIEHEPDDTETPWQWILCDRCDWGNW